MRQGSLDFCIYYHFALSVCSLRRERSFDVVLDDDGVSPELTLEGGSVHFRSVP